MRRNAIFTLIAALIGVLLFIQFLVLPFITNKDSPCRNGNTQLGKKCHGHEPIIHNALQRNDMDRLHSTPNPRECRVDVKLPNDANYLFDQMKHERWKWIKDRIQELWPYWKEAASKIHLRNDKSTSPLRKVKRIVVLPGVLRGSIIGDAYQRRQGAPLGDLVQWADLIAALHVLGHNLSLTDDFYEVGRSFKYKRFSWTNSAGCHESEPDIVYADIIAMKTIPEGVLKTFGCKFRVLDAYGTESMYNDPEFADKHNKKSTYGSLGLNLKQFYTFFPHTPDNSFLGFVVAPPISIQTNNKENIGLLYGKNPDYFKNKLGYIELLGKFMEVHATLKNSSILPKHVINHGILSPVDYKKLLQRAKFLVGVGYPLESTAPLEALAAGCIFLNPKFDGFSLSKEGKPTSRKLTSQVPYLEEFIGPPNVHTIDIKDAFVIQKAIQDPENANAKSIVPYEFTISGFLQRLGAYIENQDFCDTGSPRWPPLIAMKVIYAKVGVACTEACKMIGAICEQGFLSVLNNKKDFEGFTGRTCQKVKYSTDAVIFPAMDENRGQCYMQDRPSLFSCSNANLTLRRLCPCRTFIPQQIALCKECL